ncbi:hypothetical protein AAG565_04475 [Fontimonas sp. SYSU GA230001]|uniref:hypothetical protein n=1 Tax=Fontimonas sp. SYSU GA230001 TaxID=3142450 RepID=UPI0032B5F5CE
MDIDVITTAPEHHSPADELTLVDVDQRGVWLFAPDGGSVGLSWDELRAEAESREPSALFFRDLLARAESWRKAA